MVEDCNFQEKAEDDLAEEEAFLKPRLGSGTS